MRISDWSSDVCSSDLAREREFVESLVAGDDARMLGAEPVQRLGIDGDIGGARDAEELARGARRIGERRPQVEDRRPPERPADRPDAFHRWMAGACNEEAAADQGQ